MVVDGVHSQEVDGVSLHDHHVDFDVVLGVVTVDVLSDQGVSDHVPQGSLVLVVDQENEGT